MIYNIIYIHLYNKILNKKGLHNKYKNCQFNKKYVYKRERERERERESELDNEREKE